MRRPENWLQKIWPARFAARAFFMLKNQFSENIAAGKAGWKNS